MSRLENTLRNRGVQVAVAMYVLGVLMGALWGAGTP